MENDIIQSQVYLDLQELLLMMKKNLVLKKKNYFFYIFKRKYFRYKITYKKNTKYRTNIFRYWKKKI